MSKEKESNRIHREIERSKLLPASVGYPINIAIGITSGYEWSLSQRVRGKALSEVWNHLSWTEKISAIKQILDIMNSVHSVEIGKVEHLTLKKAWYSDFDKDRSFADMERLITSKVFSPDQGRVLRDILERFYEWNICVTPVLCHGDITTDNLLCQ